MKVTRRSEKKKIKKKEKNGGKKLKPGPLCLSSPGGPHPPPAHQQAALLCEQFLSFAIVGLRLLQAAVAKCVLLETPNNAGMQRISTLANLHCPGATCTQSLEKKKNRCIVFHPGADIGGFVG